MKDTDSSQQLQAIVIGNSTDEFVRYAIDLLNNYSIEYSQCEDIYSAVGRLAKDSQNNVLVIGCCEQLSREQGQFFRKANENGWLCCCLANRNLTHRQAPTAEQTAVLVIEEACEIKGILEKALTNNVKKGQKLSAEFIKDEFLTTRAELDALLGSGY